MARRKTMDDVAKLAGVGKVTVSYVLNGLSDQARISPETTERVLAAARELDYRPNALARMLVQQKTDTIAVVFQYAEYFRASSSFISEVMRGVCSACVSEGFDVLLHTKADADPLAEADGLTDGRVDGALILRDSGDPVVAAVASRHLPVVLFFSRSDDPAIPFVDGDNFTGAKLATNHLLDLGHRRIGMVRGSLRSSASNDRISGYRHALEMRGIAFEPDLVVPFESTSADPTAFVSLMKGPNRPTALFVWSDDIALSCLRVIADLGYSVPDDVSVVGFDSSPACERATPALTSVRQPIAEMAAMATRILVALVRGTATPEQTRVVLPLHLDVRGSTAPPTPDTHR